MQSHEGIVEAIGNTPLIALRRASARTGCTILGKAEFMNPGQSVKDRAARQMILEAEERGEIRPGGLVVESTAGNTGIGLALVANARGYRTLIVIPETPKPGKEGHAAAMRRRAGGGAGRPLRQSRQLSARRHGGWRTSCARVSATASCSPISGTTSTTARHTIVSTGPEIWEQTDGKVDGFICAIGTGGTLAGVVDLLCAARRKTS